MLSIAVVDDEKAFSNQLSQMLRRWGETHDAELTITCFDDGIDIADKANRTFAALKLCKREL